MAEYYCKQCGESNKDSMMNKGQGRKSKTLCKSCHNQNTISRGRSNRRKLIAYKGGACERCGYATCEDALEFHHKDPDTKDPSFNSIRYWSEDKAKIEVDKCLLLCANCHREKHSAVW